MINFLNVGPAGTFESSGKYETKPSEVDVFFEHAESSDKTILALHFHGGLNNEDAGIQTAKKMATVYNSGGAIPLTFVWETGIIETLRDSLTRINKKPLFRKLLKILIQRLVERTGDGLTAGTVLSESQIEAELAKDEPFATYDSTILWSTMGGTAINEVDLNTNLKDELEALFDQDVSKHPELQEELNIHIEQTTDIAIKGVLTGIRAGKLLAVIAYRVIRRHVRGRDHGFYPTIVEELLRELYLSDLGAAIWLRMKTKAADMWLPNQGLKNEEQHAGSYVIEKIISLQAKRPDIRIFLVGHSAGSIAICEMLRAIVERSLKIRIDTILFLAPAGLSKLGIDQLSQNATYFRRFRIFTMRDDYESNDKLLPKIYTRSLLYFISGVLEPSEVDVPIMGMMRHASRTGPFAKGTAADWATFIGLQNRLVLSDSTKINPTAPKGERSSSISHGGFDDDQATFESIIEFLRT